jgi:hypothetical protein
MKYGQGNDVFVCDYLAAVKNLQTDLAQMYVEEKKNSKRLLSGISTLSVKHGTM